MSGRFGLILGLHAIPVLAFCMPALALYTSSRNMYTLRSNLRGFFNKIATITRGAMNHCKIKSGRQCNKNIYSSVGGERRCCGADGEGESLAWERNAQSFCLQTRKYIEVSACKTPGTL
jgi:hypothetical protein